MNFVAMPLLLRDSCRAAGTYVPSFRMLPRCVIHNVATNDTQGQIVTEGEKWDNDPPGEEARTQVALGGVQFALRGAASQAPYQILGRSDYSQGWISRGGRKHLSKVEEMENNASFEGLLEGDDYIEMPDEVMEKMSTGQKLSYTLCQAGKIGSLIKKMQVMRPGKLNHARWLTTDWPAHRLSVDLRT